MTFLVIGLNHESETKEEATIALTESRESNVNTEAPCARLKDQDRIATDGKRQMRYSHVRNYS